MTGVQTCALPIYDTGTPTEITKTSSDQLWITYQVRVYIPTVDVDSVVTISGVDYDVTTRPLNTSNISGWGGFITVGPVGGWFAGSKESNVLLTRTSEANPSGSGYAGDGTLTSYVSGNYYLENKGVWAVDAANYTTGIGTIFTCSGASSGSGTGVMMFQHCFVTDKIPKTNTKTLTLFTRKSWARYP